MLRDLPTIWIDSREQKPYAFEGFKTGVKKLDVGDYTIDGFESRVACERKNAQDAYQCVGTSRARFERCLRRLAVVECPHIVIEADLSDFAIPPPYTRITPAQAVGSFISWSVKYRVPVWFCHGRAEAERVTLRILAAFLKHLTNKEAL